MTSGTTPNNNGNDPRLPVARVTDLDVQREREHWLVEGLWGRSAIGLIGAAPKSTKTWLGLDMAVSVASGTPVIGHFKVHAKGPALIYLAEDSLPQVRARIESICRHRGLEEAVGWQPAYDLRAGLLATPGWRP